MNTFPTLTGSNLLRQKLTLPHELHGELNILLVPFHQWQQSLVDTWIPFATALEKANPGVVYYELPTLPKMNWLPRTFINEGMRAGIPNPRSRERTVTLYVDKSQFRRQVNLPDEKTIYILLVDRQGNILWRAEGSFNPETGESLRDAIAFHRTRMGMVAAPLPNAASPAAP
ncbi:MAG: hypothetical protein JW726_13875 [Anaerolineales bacterium]|nr:hypothetical protein [Anaerolineales bacterium]